MAMSTIEPIKVQMMKLDNGNAYFKLRDNVTSTTKHNELLGSDFNFFNYDELDLQVTYVESIEQLIANSFSVYWTLATEQLNTKNTLEEKREKVLNLINNDNYALIELNEQTQGMMNSLVDAMVSMSMNSLV
jgi:hypothetical protein